jgi:hypothetical protein
MSKELRGLGIWNKMNMSRENSRASGTSALDRCGRVVQNIRIEFQMSIPVSEPLS